VFCEVRVYAGGNRQPPCGKPAAFKVTQTWPQLGITREVILCSIHAESWGKLTPI